MLVGTLDAVRRYPVKSLRGESLTGADIGWSGIPGDRASAFFVRDGNVRVGNTYRGKEHDRLHLIADAQAARLAAGQRGVRVELRAGDHFFDAAPVSILVDRWLDELSDDSDTRSNGNAFGRIFSCVPRRTSRQRRAISSPPIFAWERRACACALRSSDALRSRTIREGNERPAHPSLSRRAAQRVRWEFTATCSSPDERGRRLARPRGAAERVSDASPPTPDATYGTARRRGLPYSRMIRPGATADWNFQSERSYIVRRPSNALAIVTSSA